MRLPVVPDDRDLVNEAMTKVRERNSIRTTDAREENVALTQLLNLPVEYQGDGVVEILFKNSSNDTDQYIKAMTEKYRKLEEETRPRPPYGSRLKEMRAQKPYDRHVQHYANLLAARVYLDEWTERRKKIKVIDYDEVPKSSETPAQRAYAETQWYRKFLEYRTQKDREEREQQGRELTAARQAKRLQWQREQDSQGHAEDTTNEGESVSLESDILQARSPMEDEGSEGETKVLERPQLDQGSWRYPSRQRKQRVGNTVMLSAEASAALNNFGSIHQSQSASRVHSASQVHWEFATRGGRDSGTEEEYAQVQFRKQREDMHHDGHVTADDVARIMQQFPNRFDIDIWRVQDPRPTTTNSQQRGGLTSTPSTWLNSIDDLGMSSKE